MGVFSERATAEAVTVTVEEVTIDPSGFSAEVKQCDLLCRVFNPLTFFYSIVPSIISYPETDSD